MASRISVGVQEMTSTTSRNERDTINNALDRNEWKFALCKTNTRSDLHINHVLCFSIATRYCSEAASLVVVPRRLLGETGNERFRRPLVLELTLPSIHPEIDSKLIQYCPKERRVKAVSPPIDPKYPQIHTHKAIYAQVHEIHSVDITSYTFRSCKSTTLVQPAETVNHRQHIVHSSRFTSSTPRQSPPQSQPTE